MQLKSPLAFHFPPIKTALWEPFAGAGWASCKALNTTSPLTRYPGSKRRHFDLHHEANAAFIGESDPSVLAVWLAWLQPRTHAEVLRRLELWKNEFQSTDVEPAWEALKHSFETSQGAELAAASLALRKLTFGGVVRDGATGNLNIRYVQCQVPKFLKWTYVFPPQPSGLVHASNDWQGSWAAVERHHFEEGIAVLDPPYWLPYGPGSSRRGTGRMSPAYRGHQPHAEETKALCVEAFAVAVSDPRFALIQITNYYSEELNAELQAVCPGVEVKIGDRLDGINPGKKRGTNHLEAMWTLKRNVSTTVETIGEKAA